MFYLLTLYVGFVAQLSTVCCNLPQHDTKSMIDQGTAVDCERQLVNQTASLKSADPANSYNCAPIYPASAKNSI